MKKMMMMILLFYNWTKIAETKEEKDLRVFFTENVKPSLNCNKACKSANKTIRLIRRILRNKNAEEMLILYKTLVRLILDYCIPVWKPYAVKNVNNIEKIPKKFTKMING